MHSMQNRNNDFHLYLGRRQRWRPPPRLRKRLQQPSRGPSHFVSVWESLFFYMLMPESREEEEGNRSARLLKSGLAGRSVTRSDSLGKRSTGCSDSRSAGKAVEFRIRKKNQESSQKVPCQLLLGLRLRLPCHVQTRTTKLRHPLAS